MRKSPSDWNEEYVLSLPTEDDTLERKGSALLDLTLPESDEDKVRDELAKQLSAFANSGGGQLIYGLTDEGRVDRGGVSLGVKGRQSTKEWLEDLIPALTEFEILGVNVYEIKRDSTVSSIGSDKALFVIDIPDSERAPHQSKRDLKYYVRLGARSQPAPHRMVEDIRNRVRHPNVILSSIEFVSMQLRRNTMVRAEWELGVSLKVAVSNVGQMKASNICLSADPQCFRFDFDPHPEVELRYAATPKIMMWELRHPLYPSMGTAFRCSCTTKLGIQGEVYERGQDLVTLETREIVDNLAIVWQVYADSAPPKPRRSPRVTHICSFEVTRTQNMIWRRTRKMTAMSSAPKVRSGISH